MIDFKLANILVEVDDFTKDYPRIFMRTEGSTAFDPKQNALNCEGRVDFFTYFNAFSWCKWSKYASLDNLWLHIELSGDAAKVQKLTAKTGDTEPSTHGELLSVSPTDAFRLYDIEIPIDDDAALVSFALETSGRVQMRNAYYYTKIDESRIRPVKLALATTTFKKEEFILRNVAEVKKQVFASDEPIANGFHMFVVDNGRTLDIGAVSDDNVTVIPNANVGGSGGFARGMIAALDWNATHVLLMDDDVRVMPESFIRTYNLLALRNDAYADAFLNGAMLSLEEPNLQYEDVAYIRNSGAYNRIKDDLYIDTVADIIANEETDVEVENAYGAWWYSCIPIKAVKEHGLPLPVFVRCDDVEYGARCKPTYMCMNGICVWHSSFQGRYRAAVDCYQYTRNFLIMMATDGVSSERAFMLRLYRTLRTALRSLDYASAELTLDGIADYLKGPEFLANASGEKILMGNSTRNEKLSPIKELDPDLLESLGPDDGKPLEKRTMAGKVLEALPIDAHILPDALLKDEPAPVYYQLGAVPGSHTARRKKLLAIDLDRTHARIRVRDKKRWRAIVDRYHALTKELDQRGEEVALSYRAALPRLTSREFWEEYLKRNLENS